VEVYWTDTAISHLDSIYSYIARDSQQYALRTVDRITQRSILISEHPFSGRMVPEISIPQIREVIEGPYRIVYYIKSEQIDVLAVIHGAENFPWHKISDAPGE
jgi:toxin ParE1/3/4